MLERRALDHVVRLLCLGRGELRLGLSDVGARRDAGRVTVAGDLERAAVGDDRAAEQVALHVQRAQLHVVLCERRAREQLCRGEIARARLGRVAALLELAPQPAPEVDLPR